MISVVAVDLDFPSVNSWQMGFVVHIFLFQYVVSVDSSQKSFALRTDLVELDSMNALEHQLMQILGRLELILSPSACPGRLTSRRQFEMNNVRAYNSTSTHERGRSTFEVEEGASIAINDIRAYG